MADVFSAESRLIHAGTERAPGQPATPPLVPASIYVSQGTPRPGRGYGRDGNPGWEALEQALGGLEDAEAVAFASGQAASMALMLALAPGRERVVLAEDGYYGGRVLADRLRPHGARPVLVDLRDLAAVERALTAAPSVLWAETPTNPLLRVADLSRLGALAAASGRYLLARASRHFRGRRHGRLPAFLSQSRPQPPSLAPQVGAQGRYVRGCPCLVAAQKEKDDVSHRLR